MLGLHCYSGFSLVVASRDCSTVAVCRLLTVVVSSVVEAYRLQQLQHMGSAVAAP